MIENTPTRPLRWHVVAPIQTELTSSWDSSACAPLRGVRRLVMLGHCRYCH